MLGLWAPLAHVGVVLRQNFFFRFFRALVLSSIAAVSVQCSSDPVELPVRSPLGTGGGVGDDASLPEAGRPEAGSGGTSLITVADAQHGVPDAQPTDACGTADACASV